MTSTLRTVPDRNGPNAPHWLGAREGKVVVQVCGDCGKPRYPSTHLCPVCSSSKASWEAIRPQGHVRSWCRFHRAYFPEFKVDLPYTVFLVRMTDGVDLFANFAAEAMGELPIIGQRVEAVFEEVEPEVAVVRFRAIPAVNKGLGGRA